MAYKVDRVYNTNGAELTTSLHTTTLDGAANMEFDGRYLWVTCGSNGIAIYEWWGAASDHEPAFENLDDLIYPRYDSGAKKKLRLVTYITMTAAQIKRTTRLESLAEDGYLLTNKGDGVYAYTKVSTGTGSALSAHFIKKCNGKMYVTNGATFDKIFVFNIDSQKYESTITVTETYAGPTNEYFVQGTVYSMTSNLEAANGNLWFVGTSFGDTQPQRLYKYNVTTGVKTTININVRPSLARTFVCNGYNGSIYITDYNNVSINRYDAETGAWIETIRVNAFPTYMFSGPDRRLWVSSFGGMISLVDWDDSQVHNDWSAGMGDTMRALSLQVDPTDGSKIWFVANDQKLVRHDLNTHEQIEQGTTEDWQFSATNLGLPQKMWISPTQTYQDESLVPHTVKPYMFVLQHSSLSAFRLDRWLYREAYTEVHGQGAVVMSPQQYFGE